MPNPISKGWTPIADNQHANPAITTLWRGKTIVPDCKMDRHLKVELYNPQLPRSEPFKILGYSEVKRLYIALLHWQRIER